MSGCAKNSAAMSAARCTCGYEAVDADDLGDHFLEVFTPADDRDAGGTIHAEAAGPEPTLTCLCGFAVTGISELDAHFIAVFTPRQQERPRWCPACYRERCTLSELRRRFDVS